MLYIYLTSTNKDNIFYLISCICIHYFNSIRFSSVSNGGISTPTSVIMPFIRLAGVTSKAGFQQSMPIKKQKCFCHEHKPVLPTFSKKKLSIFMDQKGVKKENFRKLQLWILLTANLFSRLRTLIHTVEISRFQQQSDFT